MSDRQIRLMGGKWGAKSATLGDLDEFMDWYVSRGGNKGDAQDLYAAVAWVYWAVNLRADSVAAVPYSIYPMDLPEADEKRDEAIEYDIDLAPILWHVEAWLRLKAAAYILKRKGMMSGETKKLQVLNANTMEVWSWDGDGVTEFRQKVKLGYRLYPADQIVYFRTFNPMDDLKEGVSSGAVGQTAGQIIKHANEWASSFFENGAIPAVLLTTEGSIKDPERNRLRDTWNRFFRGTARAHSVAVLEKGLKVEQLSQSISDLALPDLERTRKEQILGAHNIPPGLIEAKTNRAERDALWYEFWTRIKNYMQPHIRPVLNEQLLNEQGLRISFRYNEIEAIQKAEIEKGEQSAFVIGGVVIPAFEKQLIGRDEARRVINDVLRMADVSPLDDSVPADLYEPPAPVPFGGGGGDDDGGKGEKEPSDMEARSRPKAAAPAWGAHRVSLQS